MLNGMDTMLKGMTMPLNIIKSKVNKGQMNFSQLSTAMGVNSYIEDYDSSKTVNNAGYQLLGAFFSIVLKNDALTDEMLELGYHNSGIVYLLMNTVETNPELLDQMTENLERDVRFGELFTGLAIQEKDLALFFFNKITPALYSSLTVAMVMSQETTENVAELMYMYGADELKPGKPFYDIFFDIGEADYDDDGNEQANERLFYTLMSGTKSAQFFVDALNSMSQHQQTQLLQFAIAGVGHNEAGQRVVHKNQAFYNNYAMIDGIAEGLLPLIDQNDPGYTGQEFTAADFARFLPMLFTYDSQGNITGGAPYAFHFFTALKSAAEVHGNENAEMILDLLKQSPVLYYLLPKADDNSPAPHDYK